MDHRSNATIINNLFNYTISSAIPDQHEAIFEISITDSLNNVWNISYSSVINAPNLKLENISVNDAVGGNGNGILEAGETADLTISCKNDGHSDTQMATAILSSINPFATINTGLDSIGSIPKQTTSTALFNVSLTQNTVIGTPIQLNCDLAAGAYLQQRNYFIAAGYLEEDFESGNLNQFNWMMSGNQPWYVSTYQPYEGSYCLQSGAIADNESSVISLNAVVLMSDSLTFIYRTSSEAGWDFLKLIIDGVVQDEWSGISSWNEVAVLLTTGSHTISFSYEKDNVNAVGMDCAWLDKIRFPSSSGILFNIVNSYNTNIRSFPNPADEVLNVYFTDVTDVINFQLYNNQGASIPAKIVFEKDNHVISAKIETKQLVTGLYFLKVVSKDKLTSLKFMVHHATK